MTKKSAHFLLAPIAEISKRLYNPRQRAFTDDENKHPEWEEKGVQDYISNIIFLVIAVEFLYVGFQFI